MTDPFDRAVEREKSARRGRRYRAVWKRFRIHLRIYLTVNLILAAIWAVEALVDGGHPLWFLKVAWGWGIGLFIHYLVVTQVTHQWRSRSRTSSKGGVGSTTGSAVGGGL